nr:MAG TPA: hypothetical protein [Caudoviricetes sp.]
MERVLLIHTINRVRLHYNVGLNMYPNHVGIWFNQNARTLTVIILR